MKSFSGGEVEKKSDKNKSSAEENEVKIKKIPRNQINIYFIYICSCI